MANELLTRDDIIRGKKNFDAQNKYMTGTAEEQVTLPDGQKIKTRAGLEKAIKDKFPSDTVGLRKIGSEKEDVALNKDLFFAMYKQGDYETVYADGVYRDFNDFPAGSRFYVDQASKFLNGPSGGFGFGYFYVDTIKRVACTFQIAYDAKDSFVSVRTKDGASWGPWVSTTPTRHCYTSTTATSANVVVTENGKLQRSTSSAIFKKDIADIHIDDYRAALKAVRPVSYRSTDATSDRTDWSWYSFIAEELGALDKRLVQMDSVEFFEDTNEDGTTFINSRELPEGEYAANGINTNGIVALMVHINQQMLVDIEKLEDEKTQLKRRMTNLEKRMDAIDGPAAPAE